ncbi:hypothetical protein O9992_01950 [Vibrio lentus]|nr:hypothetical protein [Vibrio lentus]
MSVKVNAVFLVDPKDEVIVTTLRITLKLYFSQLSQTRSPCSWVPGQHELTEPVVLSAVELQYQRLHKRY